MSGGRTPVAAIAVLAAACGGRVVIDVAATSGSGGASTGTTASPTSSVAGSGGTPSACPAEQPAELDPCTLGAHCAYGDSQCHCYAIFSGWTCRACPAAPSSDPICMPHQANCAYGPLQCVCFGGGAWNCAECPTQQPGGPCDGYELTGLSCDYPGAHCECFSGKWTCQ